MKELRTYNAIAINGIWILITIAIFIISIACLLPLLHNDTVGITIVLLFLAILPFCLVGFIIVQPNENIVLVFFGRYIGTIKKNGFLWTIPFVKKIKVSAKLANFNTGKIKVNDAKGSPIEISAIVVWRVSDPALAVLNLGDYHSFVTYQSDSALRTLVAKYPYDSEEGNSLKSSMETITDILKIELQDRLEVAGITIEEVRFSYLAYAPEIASLMLKKQQAEATLDARRYLVKNALLIIDDVMAHFKDREKGEFNDYSLNLVNNLLVALITEAEVKPVINVGQ